MTEQKLLKKLNIAKIMVLIAFLGTIGFIWLTTKSANQTIIWNKSYSEQTNMIYSTKLDKFSVQNCLQRVTIRAINNHMAMNKAATTCVCVGFLHITLLTSLLIWSIYIANILIPHNLSGKFKFAIIIAIIGIVGCIFLAKNSVKYYKYYLKYNHIYPTILERVYGVNTSNLKQQHDLQIVAISALEKHSTMNYSIIGYAFITSVFGIILSFYILFAKCLSSKSIRKQICRNGSELRSE